jgi:hypothetical protein
MLTDSQINGATGDQLQRLLVKVVDTAYEDSRDTNQKYEDSIVTAAAADERIADALESIAAAMTAVASRPVLSPKQQLWVDLYETHLRARKDPAVITSTTGDTVIKDIVLDAAMMTAEVFPLVKKAMADLQVPPGGVDWT